MALHKEVKIHEAEIEARESRNNYKDLDDKFYFNKIRANEMLREEGLPEYDKLIKMFKKAYPEYIL